MTLENNTLPFSRSSGPLTMQVFESFEFSESFKESWDSAVERLGGTVYMTYDWCSIWWSFYGSGKHLRIYVFSQQDSIVGLIPVYLEDLRLWPARYRVARFLGANIPPKVFDPPVAKDQAEAVFDMLLDHMFLIDHCDLVSFGPVSEANASWGDFMQSCKDMGDEYASKKEVGVVHSVFYLPASVEEFLAPFGKHRTKYRGRLELRPIRKIYKEISTKVISAPEALEPEFHRFAKQHAEQWAAEGKPGHFGDWPHAEAYNLALVKAHGARGRMRFTQVVADGQVLASQFIFSFGGCYYWELPSRESAPEYNDFRLGSTAALTMIANAIQEKITRVEGGLGYYPYKTELGAKQHPTLRFKIENQRTSSLIKKPFFDVVRFLLDYGYYKIWFRRIQPRLPVSLRNPLWSLYLKFDY